MQHHGNQSGQMIRHTVTTAVDGGMTTASSSQIRSLRAAVRRVLHRGSGRVSETNPADWHGSSAVCRWTEANPRNERRRENQQPAQRHHAEYRVWHSPVGVANNVKVDAQYAGEHERIDGNDSQNVGQLLAAHALILAAGAKRDPASGVVTTGGRAIRERGDCSKPDEDGA
jgi:hypothetical protein